MKFNGEMIRHGNRSVTVIITLAMSIGLLFPGQNKISEQEARKLAFEGIEVYGPGNDETSVRLTILPNKYDPDFYYFYAIAIHPIGSPHFGTFAVNPWTGHVWDSVGCKRLTSPTITKHLEQIRQRSGYGQKLYASLKAKKPLCIESGK